MPPLAKVPPLAKFLAPPLEMRGQLACIKFHEKGLVKVKWLTMSLDCLVARVQFTLQASFL